MELLIKRLFNPKHNIITNIYIMINSKIKHNRSEYKNVIDLHVIKKFLVDSKYSINKYYVNRENNCYGLLINDIYIPIYISYYVGDNAHYEPIERSKTTWSKVAKFIADYNSFVNRVSRGEPIYPLIKPCKILQLGNNYIGFEALSMNWYCTMTSVDVKKLSLPIKVLRYDQTWLINL